MYIYIYRDIEREIDTHTVRLIGFVGRGRSSARTGLLLLCKQFPASAPVASDPHRQHDTWSWLVIAP